jgi:hypothetical protein
MVSAAAAAVNAARAARVRSDECFISKSLQR